MYINCLLNYENILLFRRLGFGGFVCMFFKRKKSKLHKIIAYISENPQTTQFLLGQVNVCIYIYFQASSIS